MGNSRQQPSDSVQDDKPGERNSKEIPKKMPGTCFQKVPDLFQVPAISTVLSEAPFPGAERTGCPVLLALWLWSLPRQDHHQNRPPLSAFRFRVPALSPLPLLLATPTDHVHLHLRRPPKRPKSAKKCETVGRFTKSM